MYYKLNSVKLCNMNMIDSDKFQSSGKDVLAVEIPSPPSSAFFLWKISRT